MSADIQFEPGQQVRVNHVAVSIVNGEVTGRVLQPEFIGTIVGYWRNGHYIVREPEHGTTMAYPFVELSTVSES
jgi:hypothetical protein